MQKYLLTMVGRLNIANFARFTNMNDYLDYSKFRTIIYTPIGYYGSELLFNDPSYAFRHRMEERGVYINLSGLRVSKNDADKWQYLTNNKRELADKLDIDILDLPEWDFEVLVIENLDQ